MVTMLVLGGAVVMTSQVQASFKKQIEDSAGEQEGRYALEWVSRLIRAAGNNPSADHLLWRNRVVPRGRHAVFLGRHRSDGDLVNNDIRLQADSNPPDGILGGVTGAAIRRMKTSRCRTIPRRAASRSAITTSAAPRPSAPTR